MGMTRQDPPPPPKTLLEVFAAEAADADDLEVPRAATGPRHVHHDVVQVARQIAAFPRLQRSDPTIQTAKVPWGLIEQLRDVLDQADVDWRSDMHQTRRRWGQRRV